MADHPLDYPIWTALTTRQAPLAEGGELARRFPSGIAPFCALKDETPESFADSAIALYRRQGMEIRRRIYVTVLRKRI